MKNLFLTILILISMPAQAKHLYPEKYYQSRWCTAHSGQQEVIMPDGSRADCITENYAIEFDFAHKFQEAVGQSLEYSLQTGEQPGIVLIMENYETDRIFLNRLLPIAEKYNIKVWTMP